tara:strand:- start:168 stop:428 length:261 start_codon:yes stop_codon:yes gene_type:complete
MRCKKYNDGGALTGSPTRKATKKDRRKGNVSPHGLYAKDEEVEDPERKPNTINRNSTLRRLKSKVFKRKGKSKGRRTSESCRNPNS